MQVTRSSVKVIVATGSEIDHALRKRFRRLIFIKSHRYRFPPDLVAGIYAPPLEEIVITGANASSIGRSSPDEMR
jgi:hypothetical protein